ncbi:MAG: PEP-CTERM sorting domain-containing protein [Bryobacteraceae bacterium]|jgi:hypothetical protein
MRSVFIGSTLLFALVSLALADTEPVPIDPHLVAATGGDATPIGDGLTIQLSTGGGGIFVFNNNTGGNLAEIDLTIPVLSPFSLNVTTFPVGALSGFGTSFPVQCPAGEPTTASCLTLSLLLAPGTTLGAEGTNFILDFDFPHTALDNLVASGQYTGGTVTDGLVGDWIPSVFANVVPVDVTPEPENMIVMLLAGVGMIVYNRRRKVSH